MSSETLRNYDTWLQPPDPLPEREVRAYVYCSVAVQFEESMDPYDRDQVEEIVRERLQGAEKQLIDHSGLFIDVAFADVDVDNYDVMPERISIFNEGGGA